MFGGLHAMQKTSRKLIAREGTPAAQRRRESTEGGEKGSVGERGAPKEGGKDQDGHCLNEVDNEKRHDECRGNYNGRKRWKPMIS